MQTASLQTLFVALSLAACSPSQRSDDAATDSAGSDASDAREDASDVAAADSGIVPAACNAPMSDVTAAGAACVRAVEGSVRDEMDQRIERGFITVCGNACFVGDITAEGRFTVPVGEVLPVPIYSVLVHGRPSFASAYWPLIAPDADAIVRMPSALRVARYTFVGPELPQERVLSREVVATAGPVTLSFSAGSTVELDFEDFELMALGRTVRVAEVALDRAPPFAQEGAVTGPVFALAPFALLSSTPVGVTVANRANLPANSVVEFVAMGHVIVSEDPNAGRAVVAARGRVSADAMTIQTDAGQGLRALTWFGVRAAR